MLALALQDIILHINTYKRNYERGFQDKGYFGAAILNRLHVRVQIFLRSCALGEPHMVNSIPLNCQTILHAIQLNEYVPTLPSWIDLVKPNDNQSINKRKHQNDNQGQGMGRCQHLQQWDPGCVSNQMKTLMLSSTLTTNQESTHPTPRRDSECATSSMIQVFAMITATWLILNLTTTNAVYGGHS